MTTRRTPTPSVTRRICRAVAQGVPVEIAARQQGIALDTLARWMERGQKGRGKYRDFAAAVDKAEAQAIADYTVLIRKAARRGKSNAAFRWLSSRAPQFFPATSRGTAVAVNNTALLFALRNIDNISMERAAMLDKMRGGSTLLQQLKQIVAEPVPEDPRRVLLEQEQSEREALPSAEPDPPAPLAFEPVIDVVDAARPYLDPNVVEMVPAGR